MDAASAALLGMGLAAAGFAGAGVGIGYIFGKMIEAEEMIAQAKVRAQQMMEENERRMSAEAERIKANAAREIEQERRTALEEVRRYAGELGLRVAERVLERSLTDADHKRLADEALSAVAQDFEKS